MPRPMTIKGAPAWGRHAEGPIPRCLDDLAARIGPELPAIRKALGEEVEVAAAFARDPGTTRSCWSRPVPDSGSGRPVARAIRCAGDHDVASGPRVPRPS